MSFAASLRRALAAKAKGAGSQEVLTHAQGFVDALCLSLGDDEADDAFRQVSAALVELRDEGGGAAGEAEKEEEDAVGAAGGKGAAEAAAVAAHQGGVGTKLEVDTLVYAARVLVGRASGPASDRVARFARCCGGEISGPGLVSDVCNELGTREGLEAVRREAAGVLKAGLGERRRGTLDWDEQRERGSLRECRRALRLLESCGGWGEVVSLELSSWECAQGGV